MRRALLLLVLALAATSRSMADAPAPELDLQTVLASNRGTQVDSQFAGLKRRFAHHGFSYSSYKLLDQQHGALKKGSPVELKLPRNLSAKVSLVDARSPTEYELRLVVPDQHDVALTVSCGQSGMLELNRAANDPDSSAAVLLTYRLRCPTTEKVVPAASPTPDAGK
jgi:hypothetical protein